MTKTSNIDISLDQLSVGDSGRFLGFNPSSNAKAYRQKLLAMGLTPGTEFSITRVAPLKDPIELQVRGFALSLRKNEAMCLRVEKIIT